MSFLLSQSNIKIAILSDPHLSSEKKYHLKQWEMALDKAKNLEPDVYLVAGDLSEKGTLEESSIFKQSIDSLGKPCLFVPGNHDIGNKRLTGASGEISSSSVELYRKNFGADFFSKTIDGYHFICLNSQLFGSGLLAEKEQEFFLKNELRKDLPKLLLMHTPLYMNELEEPGGGYWNIEPEYRGEIVSLLKDKKIVAAISGHLHRLIVNYADILYISAPPLSFGLPEFNTGLSFLCLDINNNHVHLVQHQVSSLFN
mgnify:CR=1 FL=1